MRRLVLCMAVAASCGDSTDESMTDPTADSVDTSAAEGDELGDDPLCPNLGTPGCPCNSEMCLDPLVCDQGLCVWPPPPPPATDDGEDSSSDDGPPLCESDLECDPSEFCADNGCRSLLFGSFVMQVVYWAPSSCSDGGLGGGADLWWQLTLDGDVVGASGFVQGGCPGQWEQTVCVDGSFVYPFVLNLFDAEVTSDTLVDRLWWDDGAGGASNIPVVYLEAGAFDEMTGSGGQLHVTFDRVESCE